ncbi:hypothetical protein D5F82_08900 [Streptococcus agalactiae]|nr:hypothetical protein B7933_04705 [Streptococcus agalactiae]RRA79804.1 hypothetical protein D5F82_08900 [Streptococcus agalactiae]
MNAKPIAYPILGHFYLSNRNSRNRTDTYNQTVDNPIIKALPLPFSNHGSCPNGLVLLGAKVPVEIPVLIFKVSL